MVDFEADPLFSITFSLCSAKNLVSSVSRQGAKRGESFNPCLLNALARLIVIHIFVGGADIAFCVGDTGRIHARQCMRHPSAFSWFLGACQPTGMSACSINPLLVGGADIAFYVGDTGRIHTTQCMCHPSAFSWFLGAASGMSACSLNPLRGY